MITVNGGFEAFESEDSKFIYYTKWYEDPIGLWRVSADGGQEELITDKVRQGDWALLGDFVYYLNQSGTLMKIDLNKRDEIEIVDLGFNTSHWLSGFSVHPSGNLILFQQFDEEETDLSMLQEFQ
jgi:hypothetical protein